MLLSIIIPVYNGENKIIRCLESIAKFKESDMEFLIVNDGSTDNTAIVVEQFTHKDCRFHLINQKNKGVSGARNTGLDICRGEYVGFVDADDELTDEFQDVIDVIKQMKFPLVAFDLFYQTKEGKKPRIRSSFKEGENGQRELYTNFLAGFSNSTCIHLYRNEIIQKHNIRFEMGMAMGEDSLFNSKYFKHCPNFYYINKTPYKYYLDDSGSAVHARKLGYLKDFAKMYEGYLSIYHLDESLEFQFNTESYFWQVYEILKIHGRCMSKQENQEFRKSLFYKKITSVKYDHCLKEARKYFIKWNVYRLFLP